MSDTAPDEPLDVLATMIDEDVTIRLKSGDVVCGTLGEVDQHMNVVLSDADERLADGAAAEERSDRANTPLIIRGDTVSTGGAASTAGTASHETARDAETADADGSSSESEPDVPPTHSSPSAAPTSLAPLKAQLEDKGLAVTYDEAGEKLIVTKLGQEYRISPEREIAGDGPFRSQLASVVANADDG